MTDREMQNYSGQEEIVDQTTLIEASAGTGKTYNITELVLRLLLERHFKLEKMLVVTFTRAATAELKERIDARLQKSLILLQQHKQGINLEENKEFQQLQASIQKGELQIDEAITCLQDAQDALDMGSISTIHGFCQRILTSFGFETDIEFESELQNNVDDLMDEIIHDYTRQIYETDDPEWYLFLSSLNIFEPSDPYSRQTLKDAVKQLVRDPQLVLDPKPLSWSAIKEHFDRLMVQKEETQKQLRALRDLYLSDPPVFEKSAPTEAQSQSFKNLLMCDPVFSLDAFLSLITMGQVIDQYSGETLPCSLSSLPGWSGLPPFRKYTRFAFQYDRCKTPKQVDHLPKIVELFEDLVVQLARKTDPPYFPELQDCAIATATKEVYDRLILKKQQKGVMTFDDLLTRLSAALSSDQGPELCRMIREQYDAALIDEFQDTDDTQWKIFSQIFQGKPLYLIGDPKQSIYAFRGANIHTYLAAKQSAGSRQFTMQTNWRSDKPLICGMNQLFANPKAFGAEGIDYVQVQASEKHLESGYAQEIGVQEKPIQIRYFDDAIQNGSSGDPISGSGQQLPQILSKVVAQDILRFLETRPYLKSDDPQKIERVHPGHLAVLVSTNNEALEMQKALFQVNIPAVLSGMGSVYDSQAAIDLLYWIDACLTTNNSKKLCTFASTPLCNLFEARDLALLNQPEDVEDADQIQVEERFETLRNRLIEWRKLIESHGFLFTFHQMIEQMELLERLLSLTDGERYVTDLFQLGELLFCAEHEQHLNLDQLREHLAAEIAKKKDDLEGKPDIRQLESDDHAVQIMTVHKSKGLQFPFVWIPFLLKGASFQKSFSVTDLKEGSKEKKLCLHKFDTEHGQEAAVKEQTDLEQEMMRKLYVALTRPQHRVTVYLGQMKSEQSERAPLKRLLNIQPQEKPSKKTPKDAEALAKCKSLFDALQAISSEFIEISACQPPIEGAFWQDPFLEAPELCAAEYSRQNWDRRFATRSYSRLAEGCPESPVAHPIPIDGPPLIDGDESNATEDPELDSDIEQNGEDEPDIAEESGLLFNGLPRNRQFGSAIHCLFENIDFCNYVKPGFCDSPEMRQISQLCLRREGLVLSAEDHQSVRHDVKTLLEAPLLIPEFPHLSLSQISNDRRRCEFEFDLSVCKGALWRMGRACKIERFADIMAADHFWEEDYLPKLKGVLATWDEIAGYLTGSIDLVFTCPGQTIDRYVIVDYKTNSLASYQPKDLRAAMASHHYFLQGYIYMVALHRFLKQRLLTYDYDRNMVGIENLFLRGMGRAGEGCYFYKPSKAVIEQLDALLEGEDAA